MTDQVAFASGSPTLSSVAAGTVSVVIPNYNHGHFLPDAVASAMAQTYSRVEVIIVDDGSTDDTPAIVERLVSRYGQQLRYIYQKNAGLSAARNTGLAVAQGEYVVWLDADDLLEPTYIETMLNAVEQADGVDGVYCGYRFVDEQNRNLPRVERRTVAPGELHDALLMGNFWVPESPLVRKTCYEALGGFDTSFRSCEDWDLWLRMSRTRCLIGIADVLIRYRVVVGSMSSNVRRMLDYRLLALHKQLGDPPVAGGDSVAHRAYARAYFRGTMEYIQSGDEPNAVACLRTAAIINPQLVLDHGTYYELACSAQGRGDQGSIARLDIGARQIFLFDVIAQVASSSEAGVPQLPRPHAADTRAMQAYAMWAVGKLHYEQGSYAAARRALLRAGWLDRSFLCKQDFVALLMRTMLTTRQMALLKQLAHRPGTSNP